MPELPEVEEVRRTLEPQIAGQCISAVFVHHKSFVAPAGIDLASLIGHRFTQVLRHGKKLFCVLDDSQTLHFHLGMTGRIACAATPAPILGHTHFVVEFVGGTQLRFRDPRRFGGVWYYQTFENAWAVEVENRLGPDALKLRPQDLAVWKDARGRLKARLLNQRDVAGLGNIYVDEALWMAHLHPLQRVDRIPTPGLAALVTAIHRVLNRSIAAGGTTLRDYRNASDESGRFRRQLQAYGRADQPCRRCTTPLKSIVAGGRTTVFCPACQKRH